MNILSRLLGGISRGGRGRRSLGRARRSYGGRARYRRGGGFFGSSMGRMTLGSLAAYATRRFFGRRRMRR